MAREGRTEVQELDMQGGKSTVHRSGASKGGGSGGGCGGCYGGER